MEAVPAACRAHGGSRSSGTHAYLVQQIRRFVGPLFSSNQRLTSPSRNQARRCACVYEVREMLDVELLHLKDLPDEAVLTERQAARLLNISIDTLKRLDQSHEGPPLVWLSPRR